MPENEPQLKWSSKGGVWISGPYKLDRQRVPMSVSGGQAYDRYSVECDGIWIGQDRYLSDAKRTAQTYAAQVAAGVVTWPPDGYRDNL